MKHKLASVFIIVWPLVAVFLSFSLSLNALVSPILFFGVPALFLSLLKPQFVKKTFLVSLLIEPFMIIVDYIAQITHTWSWPMPYSSFTFRVFHHVSIESLIWGFLQTYVVIIFFQFFFGKYMTKHIWNKRSQEALFLTAFISIIFLVLLFLVPTFLNIPFWYLTFGFILITPLVFLEKLKYPHMFSRLVKAGVYFFYLNFTYEITALKIGWWTFPSKQFIGHVSFFLCNFSF